MKDSDISESYHEEDGPTWALALAGSSRGVRDRVLSALRPRVATSLLNAMERLGPFRLDDAEAAQAEIAERLRGLHDLGAVSLPEPSSQEVMLV